MVRLDKLFVQIILQLTDVEFSVKLFFFLVKTIMEIKQVSPDIVEILYLSITKSISAYKIADQNNLKFYKTF